MISYYPPRLIPFLQLKAWRFPTPAPHFYLSWEDALWEIMSALHLEPGCTVLLPDFYCLDVIHNIEAHGYQVATYPLDIDFQIKDELLLSYIHRHRPRILILFHAAGLTNQQTRARHFLSAIPQNCYILEDSVHRLVNPRQIKLWNPRHLILDSLRKNIPLPGSFCYCDSIIGARLPEPRGHDRRYRWGTLWHYVQYRLLLQIGDVFKNRALIKRAHHSTLRSHDDLVGDARFGHPGWPWVPTLYRHVNFAKIAAHKSRQVAVYLAVLKPLVAETKLCHLPHLDQKDWGSLHAFPLVVPMPQAASLAKQLDRLNVWAKFPDAPWSESRRVFFLPLGPHLTSADQHEIVEVIKVWLRAQSPRPHTTKARKGAHSPRSQVARSPSKPSRA